MDHFVRFEMRFLETFLYTLQITPVSVTVFPYHNRLREFEKRARGSIPWDRDYILFSVAQRQETEEAARNRN